MEIQRLNGDLVEVVYVRHLRTLTSNHGLVGSNRDLDLYRLADGTEIVCESPSNDGRATPVEVEGLTVDAALFLK